MNEFEYLTPQKAWAYLSAHRNRYYRQYIAAYSGDRRELNATSDNGMFWSRPGKAKVHVPIGADIAATSADLLFSEEPAFSVFDEATEANGSLQQKRLDELVQLNHIHAKLNEAAESAAVLGDVYMKLNWNPDALDYPIISVVQADSAWPEYVLGQLQAIHFFSIVRVDPERGDIVRVYERYEKGRILSAAFKGDQGSLGDMLPSEILEQLGIEPEVIPPVDALLAVHIPNMRPNRKFRDSNMGRSDLDGLRSLMDSLDEVYSSWMRDIRLAKARLIVPAEYLRRKASDMFKDGQYTYEFDEDVETLVALDIDPEHAGSGITSSQFAIRSADHAATIGDLVSQIVTTAGYAPQTFGIGIEGQAQSGTALHIREKKSYNTRGKKQTYWKPPLEGIMTSLIRLDAALYPGKGSDADDEVKVQFADVMANDISTTSAALQMLNSAAAISTEMKVRMLHPDWTSKQIDEEVNRVKLESGLSVDEPDVNQGDFETPDTSQEPDSEEQTETPPAIPEEYDSGNY